MIGVSIFLRFLSRVVDFIGDLITTVVLWGTVLFGYVCLSLVLYAVLRKLVVPEKFHAKPVYFQYEPCLPQQAQNGLCPFPRADFVLGSDRRLLVSGQPYQVTVILELPESPVNMDLGMFMVNLSFYSSSGHMVSSSARPVLLRYKSYIIHLASTFLYLVPLTLGLMEQKQIIPVELYESYYDSYSEPATFASVVITSHHIQVYSAVLTIEATFSGFIYLLYQWPVTMAFVSSFCICSWLMICTLALWIRQWIGPIRRLVRRQSARPHQILSSRYVANVSPVQAPQRQFGTPPRGYVGQGGPKLVATAGGRFAVISEENGKQMKRNLSVEDTRKLLLQHGVQPQMLPRSYSDVFPSSDTPSPLKGSPSVGESHGATNRPLSNTPSPAGSSGSKNEPPALARRLSSTRKVSFNISEDEDTTSDDAHERDVFQPADDQTGVPRFRKTKL